MNKILVKGNDVTGYVEIGPFRAWYEMSETGAYHIMGHTFHLWDEMIAWIKAAGPHVEFMQNMTDKYVEGMKITQGAVLAFGVTICHVTPDNELVKISTFNNASTTKTGMDSAGVYVRNFIKIAMAALRNSIDSAKNLELQLSSL